MNSFCELVLSFNLKIIFHIVLSVYIYQYERVWKKVHVILYSSCKVSFLRWYFAEICEFLVHSFLPPSLFGDGPWLVISYCRTAFAMSRQKIRTRYEGRKVRKKRKTSVIFLYLYFFRDAVFNLLPDASNSYFYFVTLMNCNFSQCHFGLVFSMIVFDKDTSYSSF